MKRFWQTAAAVPHAAGFALALDEKIRHTPAGHAYVCPTQALAQHMVAEWQAAGENFDPRTMPFTLLVATVHDRVAPLREAIVTGLAAAAVTDLLRFRVAQPRLLAERQHELWQPYLDWGAEKFGIELPVTNALQPPPLPEAASAALLAAIPKYDDCRLTALQQAADMTGSLILGLALVEAWQTAEIVFQAAELEALCQMEQWGADEQAVARHAAIKAELIILEKMIRAL